MIGTIHEWNKHIRVLPINNNCNHPESFKYFKMSQNEGTEPIRELEMQRSEG